MSKQRATLYFDKQLWRDFRAACVQRGYSASQIIETLIREQMTAWMMDGVGGRTGHEGPKTAPGDTEAISGSESV